MTKAEIIDNLGIIAKSGSKVSEHNKKSSAYIICVGIWHMKAVHY